MSFDPRHVAWAALLGSACAALPEPVLDAEAGAIDAGIDARGYDVATSTDGGPTDTLDLPDAGHSEDTGRASDTGRWLDAPNSGDVGEPAPPRPMGPLSTSTVTSRRPTLRWALAAASDGARVELCADRSCTHPIATVDVVGSSAPPPTELPEGVVFWRLRSLVGTAVGAATSPTWQFIVGARSTPVDTSWGTSLDLNGDGYTDVAVGAYPALGVGRVYVYSGGSAGLDSTPPTVLTGPGGPNGYFGYAVASAGDVNGDGYADLAVGAWGVSALTGAVYIYLGGPAGLSNTPSITLSGPDGAGAEFGASVSSAGDVDGDGYPELAVGAPAASSSVGHVFVYRGGVLPTDPIVLAGPPGTRAEFGTQVAAAGDLDGDGYADVAVGAPGVSSATGQVFVYSGSGAGIRPAPTVLVGPDGPSGRFGQAVANAGDVNGDGCSDLVLGAYGVLVETGRAYVFLGSATGVETVPAVTMTGPDGVKRDFGFAVATAGDVNHDGYADLAVGAPGVSSSVPIEGRAYVYLGSDHGLDSVPASILVGPDGRADMFGWSLASISDANEDGRADLVIGAYYAASRAGRVHVFLGSAMGVATVPAASFTGPDGALGFFGYSIY